MLCVPENRSSINGASRCLQISPDAFLAPLRSVDLFVPLIRIRLLACTESFCFPKHRDIFHSIVQSNRLQCPIQGGHLHLPPHVIPPLSISFPRLSESISSRPTAVPAPHSMPDSRSKMQSRSKHQAQAVSERDSSSCSRGRRRPRCRRSRRGRMYVLGARRRGRWGGRRCWRRGRCTVRGWLVVVCRRGLGAGEKTYHAR